jgi:hypothetical protein
MSQTGTSAIQTRSAVSSATHLSVHDNERHEAWKRPRAPRRRAGAPAGIFHRRLCRLGLHIGHSFERLMEVFFELAQAASRMYISHLHLECAHGKTWMCCSYATVWFAYINARPEKVVVQISYTCERRVTILLS